MAAVVEILSERYRVAHSWRVLDTQPQPAAALQHALIRQLTNDKPAVPLPALRMFCFRFPCAALPRSLFPRHVHLAVVAAVPLFHAPWPTSCSGHLCTGLCLSCFWYALYKEWRTTARQRSIACGWRAVALPACGRVGSVSLRCCPFL